MYMNYSIIYFYFNSVGRSHSLSQESCNSKNINIILLYMTYTIYTIQVYEPETLTLANT